MTGPRTRRPPPEDGNVGYPHPLTVTAACTVRAAHATAMSSHGSIPSKRPDASYVAGRDVLPMRRGQHARQLLDGGDARGEWLALVRSEPGVGPLVPTTVIATEPDALCSLCDDYGPRVAYHQPGGQVLRLHAACQAIWLEERDRVG